MRQSSLDAAVYQDPARHALERARLFHRLPLCLGHADQLREPASMLARDVAGVPVLLMRDGAGEIGAFVNACRHRGARLLEPDGAVCQRASLTCRYHGWTYDPSGRLAALPRREAFPTLDRAARGLRRLPSAVRHGLIWVVLDPDRGDEPDIAAHLGALDAELAAIGLGAHRFFRQHAVRRAANWKLMIDAFLEVYHVKRLHAGTIGPFFADSLAVSAQIGPHQRMLVARDISADMRAPPPVEPPPVEPAPEPNVRRHATMVHLVFPNSIIVYHPDYISHIGVFPLAPDDTLFVHSMLIPEDPADAKAATHWERSFALIDAQVFNAEDLYICEQIQQGLLAGSAETFVLGAYEENIAHFHAAIAAAIAGDCPPPLSPPPPIAARLATHPT